MPHLLFIPLDNQEERRVPLANREEIYGDVRAAESGRRNQGAFPEGGVNVIDVPAFRNVAELGPFALGLLENPV